MFADIPSSSRVTKILRFQLQRAEIERRCTKRALRWLQALVADRDTAWANRNTLAVEVFGYDDLPPLAVPFITRKSGVARLIDLGGV